MGGSMEGWMLVDKASDSSPVITILYIDILLPRLHKLMFCRFLARD